jgi:hypothetical protein
MKPNQRADHCRVCGDTGMVIVRRKTEAGDYDETMKSPCPTCKRGRADGAQAEIKSRIRQLCAELQAGDPRYRCPHPVPCKADEARETIPEMIDTMVRDFCAVGPRPKSEVRRRLIGLYDAGSSQVAALQAELAKCGKENCMGHEVEGCRSWVAKEALERSEEKNAALARRNEQLEAAAYALSAAYCDENGDTCEFCKNDSQENHSEGCPLGTLQALLEKRTQP